MPQYPIPPWLRPPPDRGANYAAGYQLRNQMAQANMARAMQARALEQQAANAEANRQLQRQQMQQQMQLAIQRQQLAQQELEQRKERAEQEVMVKRQAAEISKAYHESMISLRKAEAEEKQRLNAENIKDTARRFAAMQEYQKKMATAKDRDVARIALQYAPALSRSGTMPGAVITAAQKASEPPFIPKYADVGGRRMWQKGDRSWTLGSPVSLSPLIQQYKAINSRIGDIEKNFPVGTLALDEPIKDWSPAKIAGWRKAKDDISNLRADAERVNELLKREQSPSGANRFRIERDEQGNLVLPKEFQSPTEEPSVDEDSGEEDGSQLVYPSVTDEEEEPAVVYPD